MFAPLDAVPTAEVLDRTIANCEKISDDLVRTRQIRWAVGVSEACRLLLVQVVPVAGHIELDIAAGRLIREPLANVALTRSRRVGQFLG